MTICCLLMLMMFEKGFSISVIFLLTNTLQCCGRRIYLSANSFHRAVPVCPSQWKVQGYPLIQTRGNLFLHFSVLPCHQLFHFTCKPLCQLFVEKQYMKPVDLIIRKDIFTKLNFVWLYQCVAKCPVLLLCMRNISYRVLFVLCGATFLYSQKERNVDFLFDSKRIKRLVEHTCFLIGMPGWNGKT